MYCNKEKMKTHMDACELNMQNHDDLNARKVGRRMNSEDMNHTNSEGFKNVEAQDLSLGL